MQIVRIISGVVVVSSCAVLSCCEAIKKRKKKVQDEQAPEILRIQAFNLDRSGYPARFPVIVVGERSSEEANNILLIHHVWL
jgi:hypothetical protein